MARIRSALGRGDNAFERGPDEMDDLPVVELAEPVHCAYEKCGREIEDGAYANLTGDGEYYCSDGCSILAQAVGAARSVAVNFVRVKYKT